MSSQVANEALRFMSGLPPENEALQGDEDDIGTEGILCDPKAHNLVATSSVECSLGAYEIRDPLPCRVSHNCDPRRFHRPRPRDGVTARVVIRPPTIRGLHFENIDPRFNHGTPLLLRVCAVPLHMSASL